MVTDKIRDFVSKNHNAVLGTFRENGAIQMSIISCGAYRDGVAFTTVGSAAKLANLRRNPKCTLLLSQADWWNYMVLEGKAKLLSPENTDPEELRIALQEVYRAVAMTDHPDWDDYDRAMREDRRSAIIVAPEHSYGPAT